MAFSIGLTVTPLALVVIMASTEPVQNPITCNPTATHATITRVIDGDTIVMQAHLGLGVHVDVTVRLFGIDTPEVRGKEKVRGLEAKAFVDGWADEHGEVMLTWHGRGKYGRELAEVCPADGGACLIPELRRKGFAE